MVEMAPFPIYKQVVLIILDEESAVKTKQTEKLYPNRKYLKTFLKKMTI